MINSFSSQTSSGEHSVQPATMSVSTKVWMKLRRAALVHGSGLEQTAIFEAADYAVAAFRRADFGQCAGKRGVEDGTADGDFGLLNGKRPCPQTSPDDGLVSPYGGLDQRAVAVAVGDLTFHPAVSADCGDMLVTCHRA